MSPLDSHAKPSASVIIPNWNGFRHLPACLGALQRQTLPAERLEVIVVDSGSADASAALVRAAYPQVRLLLLGRNRGFSAAVNAGIRAAQGGLVLLLNNDAVADPQWASALLDAAQRKPEFDLFASKMLLFRDPGVLNSAGDLYRLDGQPGSRGVWERDLGQYDREEEVFGACGGAAGYRRSLFDEIGLFDEDFFAYCEDVDLNWRARLAGRRAWYVPGARVYHHLSATGGGPLASFYTGRNFLNVLIKDVPGELLRRHWRAMLRAQLRFAWESLRHFREPAARARLAGQLAALRQIPLMLRKRRELRRRARVSTDALAAVLTPAHLASRTASTEPVRLRRTA